MEQPTTSFSIYAVRFMDPATGLPAGKVLEVLQSSSLNFSGENINLNGGANRYPYEIESGDITPELALAFSELPSYVPKYMLGATIVDKAASIGSVDNAYASVGASMLDAAHGIASVGTLAGSEANIKTTKYFLKAKGAQLADLYAASDIDFQRGVEKDFLDDDGKIAEDLDFSADVDLTDFGIKFTIVGVPTFEVGDVVEFEATGENEGGYDFEVGASNSKFPEFRIILYAEISSTGQFFEIDCYRCQATGLPLGFTRKEFQNSEVTVGLKYDATRKKVYHARKYKLA